MEKVIERLVSVKSFVTLAHTAVFCVLALRGTIPPEFLTIYTVVIGFYFGTQAEKLRAAREAEK